MNLFVILLLINSICLFGKQITKLNHITSFNNPFTKQKTHQKKQTFLNQLKKQQKQQKQQQNKNKRTIMRKKDKNKK